MFRRSKNKLSVYRRFLGQFAINSTQSYTPKNMILRPTSHLLFIVAALRNRAGHIILALRFLSSIYLSIYLPIYLSIYLSIFFSSPNLNGRTLDVYHTFTHGVALVRT